MMGLKPSRVTTTVVGLAAVFLLALTLATASLLWNTRQEVINDSEAKAALFASGAEAALNRSLLGVDVLLASMDELLGLSGKVVDWIDAPTASQLMSGAAQQNLMVRYVALIDAQG